MMAMNHDEMMKMYFYFGVEDVQMLFKSWVVNSPKEMALSCLVMFFLTLFHEWLRVWRDNLVTSELRLFRFRSAYAQGLNKTASLSHANDFNCFITAIYDPVQN